jgi:hydrophobe/amphiphile efflux-3 (HAE3) family protein
VRGLPALFERLGGALSRHPALALVAALLLVGVAVTGAAGLTSVTGDRAFVGSDPTLSDHEESFDRGTVAVLVDGDPTEPATMRAIDRFDRRLTGVEHVETVLSPADRVRRQYGGIPDSAAKVDRALRSDDETVVRVVMEPDLTQAEQAPVYEAAVDARDWAAFPAGVSVTVTGQPAFDAQTQSLIESSTRQLLGLAAGLMIVSLFLLFRGVRLRLLPIVAVLVGVVYTFGAMGYLGLPNSTLTSAVFPILIGLGIDYSVQFHGRYEEELARGPPREALPRAMRGIGPPVLIAMGAAAMGFAATWVTASESPAFVWFAQTSVVGILLTYLTATVVLVPTLTLYDRWRGGSKSPPAEGQPTPDGGEDVGALGRALGRTARATAKRPGTVLVVAGLLLSSGLYASTTLDVVADTEEFVPDDLPALLDLQQFRIQAGGGSDVQYPVLVSGGNEYDPETLRWMAGFERAASTQPQVVGVDTPADAVRRHNGGELPATEAGVRRAVERMPDAERERYFSNGHAQIVVFGQPDMSPRQLIAFGDNVESSLEVSRPPPGVDAELTGTSVAAAEQNYTKIVGRNATTLLGGLFVLGLFLLYYYRTPVRALAPMVPMAFVVGWQGLYMAALDIAVSPLGASLGALTIGIGAEYTVIVMERYYEEKAAGADPLEAVETAASRVGKAITVSGLTTVFGFSALLLSPFPIVSDFGFLTVGVVALTLVAALLVMPPTLVTLDAVASDLRRWRAARTA